MVLYTITYKKRKKIEKEGEKIEKIKRKYTPTILNMNR